MKKALHDPIELAPENDFLTVVENGSTRFTVVHSFESNNDAVEIDVQSLAKKLKAVTGVGFVREFDLTDKASGSDKPEILVGPTNRKASTDLMNSLPEHSYGIRVTDRQVVIAGSDETMLAIALYEFEKRFLTPKNYEHVALGHFELPIGTDILVTDASLSEHKALIESEFDVIGLADTYLHIPKTNGFANAQGIATDGKYFYSVLTKYVHGVETGIIVKCDLKTREIVKVSDEIATDHGNDLCYNAKKNVLILDNMKGSILTLVDPDTLEVKEVIYPEEFYDTIWCLSYNSNYDAYTFGSDCMIISDGEFKIKNKIPIRAPFDYTCQGMDCDDSFIYLPLSCSSVSKVKDNIVLIYSWDGKLTRIVHIDTVDESESMINVDGRFFVGFNKNGCELRSLRYVAVYRGSR